MHFNVLIKINVQRHFVQSPFLMQTHSGTSRMLDFGRRPGHMPPCSGDSSKGSWRGGEGTPGVLWGRGGTVRLGTGQPGLPCRRAAARPLQVPDPGWPAGPGATLGTQARAGRTRMRLDPPDQDRVLQPWGETGHLHVQPQLFLLPLAPGSCYPGPMLCQGPCC